MLPKRGLLACAGAAAGLADEVELAPNEKAAALGASALFAGAVD